MCDEFKSLMVLKSRVEGLEKRATSSGASDTDGKSWLGQSLETQTTTSKQQESPNDVGKPALSSQINVLKPTSVPKNEHTSHIVQMLTWLE